MNALPPKPEVRVISTLVIPAAFCIPFCKEHHRPKRPHSSVHHISFSPEPPVLFVVIIGSVFPVFRPSDDENVV